MVSTLTRMVFIKNKKTGNISSFLMSIVGSKAYHANNEVKLGNNNYLQREKNFSGYIMYHDLTGKYVNGWVYKNGKIKGTLSKQTGDDLKTELKMAVACSTYEITTYYEQCTLWYKDSNGDRKPQPGEYTNTTCKEYSVTSTYMECQPYLTDEEGGGGYIPAADEGQPCNCVNTCPVCGGCLELELKSAILPGSGGTPTVSCPACSCPKVIDTDVSFVGTKAECVKLKLENGSIINTLLAGFDLDQSLIDVTYKVGNLTGANGECFLNGRRIDITIDQDRLNATSMELANTILHETFHAYIYGKLYDSKLHTGLCPEPNFVDDFETYKQQFGDQSQHNYMANKYIEYMRNGLQDYFGGESYRTTFLNYVGDMTQWYGEQNLMECLSWSGLKGTVAWSEYYLNQTNKTRYDETMQYIVPLLLQENCNE
jgi:hypothetical protein